ncbi:hypothetical protein MCOR32_005611 [Pyricularia oryzae]|nr:hypothetical protein MCOR32_005611 [Pyricularia oryzae]KAI6447176.1 hypothetical protein MCOR15_010264 [Pyricularia oryzae]KAI6512795.1 hypothetical protein MCOR16_011099 [Pyricularia oryzae]
MIRRDGIAMANSKIKAILQWKEPKTLKDCQSFVDDTILPFGPPAGILLTFEATVGYGFVGLPPDAILVSPVKMKIEPVGKRSWQTRTAYRRGLPCAAAFTCTDYKIQGRSLDRIALELRGTLTTGVDGVPVASACDPYSLYVQLSRCTTLGGIKLLSEVREKDFVDSRVPQAMAEAEAVLGRLSEATVEAYERN